MQKRHKKGVLAYLRFIVAMIFSRSDLEVKTYSRLNRFKDQLNGMEVKTLAKANKEEIVRICELLDEIEVLPNHC